MRKKIKTSRSSRTRKKKDPPWLCNSLPTPWPTYFSSKPEHLERRFLSEGSKKVFITPKGRCCRNIKTQGIHFLPLLSAKSLKVSLFVSAIITLFGEFLHLSARKLEASLEFQLESKLQGGLRDDFCTQDGAPQGRLQSHPFYHISQDQEPQRAAGDEEN